MLTKMMISKRHVIFKKHADEDDSLLTLERVLDDLRRVRKDNSGYALRHLFIGGEGNGGIILPDLHYGRDGILAVAMTLQNLAERGATVSTLVSEIPSYHIDKRKFELGGKSLTELYAHLENTFAGAEVDRRDGLRFAWDRSWVHVRPSNTEPVARIIAEAPNREEAERLCLTVEKR